MTVTVWAHAGLGSSQKSEPLPNSPHRGRRVAAAVSEPLTAASFSLEPFACALVFSISYLSQHCNTYMSCISIARLPGCCSAPCFRSRLHLDLLGVLGERPDLPPDWGHNNKAIRHGGQMGTLQLDQASLDAASPQGYTTCLPECTQVDAHGRTPVYRFRPGV